MAALGAHIEEQGVRIPVQTLAQAKRFFREMAARFPLNQPIADNDSAWLTWLVKGHPEYRRTCPSGVDYFMVYTNAQLGHGGSGRTFAFVPMGSRNDFVFSVADALHGTTTNKGMHRGGLVGDPKPLLEDLQS